VIPYPINLDVYKPLSQHCARESLGLPLDRKLVLFGADRGSATGSRKGFDLLKKALWELHERRSDFDIVLFGQRRFPLEDLPPVVAHFPGSMSDDVSLALLYSAADVFVAPSRQDNLPNTVIESLACGTPVVAFNIGGMPDMIQHSGNGYLAAPFDVGDLAQGIHLTIDLAVSDRDALSERCRQSALQSFSPNSVAKSYQEIYRGIMAR
jgi:glycosyltransferase involved in cell wall biosynthesis